MVKILADKTELHTTKAYRFFSAVYKESYTAVFLYKENELSSPYVLRAAALKLLHETHLGHFGIFFLECFAGNTLKI